MPELPEAEANRLRIERSCLHRTIEAADLGEDTSYIELPGDNERKRLAGHQFTATQRHGKLVFAGSASGPWIAVHLGMSGKLLPFDAGEEPPDHTKFVIRFEGKRRLAFRCPRKLGWLRVVDNPQAELDRLGFGPDALAMDRDRFCTVVGGTNGTVKGALLDQHKLAGVGNLWSDEILYRTGIAPQHKASAPERGHNSSKCSMPCARCYPRRFRRGPITANCPMTASCGTAKRARPAHYAAARSGPPR